MKQKLRKWQVWLFDKEAVEKDFKRYLEEKTIRKIPPNSRLVKIHLNKAFHNLDFEISH